MAFKYPDKPWVDGQEIKMMIGHKEVVVAKYDASKNLWQHLQVNEKGVFVYAYACEIIIDRDKCPADPCLETISWDNIKDVQTALDWIYLRLQELFEKVELLEKRVKQNEIDIDFLYATLSAIDDLSNVTELLDKLEEVIEKLDNLNAGDIKQGPNDAGRFSNPQTKINFPFIVSGSQQETNYTLLDLINANVDELEHILWFGIEPPGDDDGEYKFWWDTQRLELLISFNGQWWPVSIPPAQVEFLRQELDAIYESIGNTRRDIVYNKNDIDTLAMDVDGKLATLEEELEQLATSLERGSWTFTMNYPPGPGEYTMIEAFLDEDAQEALCNQEFADCQIAAAGDPVASAECSRLFNTCMNSIDGSRIVTTDDWTECDELVFNDVDMNGTNHGWGGIDSDHYIDVFNMNDENYMVGDIATHGGGTFSFDLISSKGVASGPATVKIFKSEGTVDFDQYVRKQGDTMTGELKRVDENNNPAIATQPDHVTTKAYVDQTSPIGTIVFWGGTIAKIPTGWVECRGQLAPDSVTAITGVRYIPNLKDYLPAGAGGRFGASVGSYEQSKIKRHNHSWSGPADRKGFPNGSGDTSTGTANKQSYWRGNKSATVSSSYGLTSSVGDDITAPPVYIGVYIMRIS